MLPACVFRYHDIIYIPVYGAWILQSVGSAHKTDRRCAAYGVDILADSRAGTCMVFVPAGRDTGYSILPDSTETHIQSGDKKTGYNRPAL